MIRPLLALTLAAAALTACAPTPGEVSTQGGYASQGGIPLGPYFLVGLGPLPVPERDYTMTLGAGTISGRTACNTFTGTNGAVLPAFQITALNWTDAPCRDSKEQQFLQALTRVQSVEFAGDVLVMKAPDVWLTFEAGIVPGKP